MLFVNLFLFHSETPSGNKYSREALNTFRSTLSFFLKLEIPNLGYQEKVTCLFQSFYKIKPSFGKYIVTWDIGKVLRFLATWHPPTAISLK